MNLEGPFTPTSSCLHESSLLLNDQTTHISFKILHEFIDLTRIFPSTPPRLIPHHDRKEILQDIADPFAAFPCGLRDDVF
jgi:hypothetical protein